MFKDFFPGFANFLRICLMTLLCGFYSGVEEFLSQTDFPLLFWGLLGFRKANLQEALCGWGVFVF